jgi:hypothetical protein
MSSTVPSTIWGLIKVAGDGLVALVFHHSPVALLIVKSIIIVSANQAYHGDERFWHIYYLNSSNLVLKMLVI